MPFVVHAVEHTEMHGNYRLPPIDRMTVSPDTYRYALRLLGKKVFVIVLPILKLDNSFRSRDNYHYKGILIKYHNYTVELLSRIPIPIKWWFPNVFIFDGDCIYKKSSEHQQLRYKHKCIHVWVNPRNTHHLSTVFLH